MSFLGHLFHKKHSESVVLIDISKNSVAGAYARCTEGEPPTLIYSRCLPVEIRGDEPEGQAMIRALKILGDDLMRDGAPRLVDIVGNGRVNSILVSVDAPWQKTTVRTEHFEQNMPFVFNKQMVMTALEKASTRLPNQMITNESIIGTVLNGYETHDPYGKLVHRASISILTSYIDERVAKDIHATLRSLYHTKNSMLISGNSLRYQAMRTVFPHERDSLIMDAIGPLTSIALIRGGLLAEIVQVLGRTAHSAIWLKEITIALTKLAKQFPLPRTIFLLAHDPLISSLKEILDTTSFSTLWLSDNPPKIVSVLGSHLSGIVQQSSTIPSDLSLLLMAVYFQQHGIENSL